jgi:glycosyltransferase involved in cell wall biosynthesis
VHVVTRSGDTLVAAPPGVTVHRVLAPPLIGPDAVAGAPVAEHLGHAAAVHRAVAEIHEREPLDAVVTPLWGCEGVVCLLDERFPTVVSCMTSATTIQELRGAGAEPSAETAQLIGLERATMRRARYAHGLTRAALGKTLSDYGAEPLQAEVVGRGASDRAAIREAAGATARGAPEILFVGRLERRKGVDALLGAAERLAAGGVRLSLVLVGPDSDDTETGEPYRRSFERAPGGDPDLRGLVRFAGAVDDEELDSLYAGADIVCVPSRYESHGVVLVEAMMFGKPIVACAAGGVPEVVEEGGNALLAAPGDPDSLADRLRRLLVDPDLRRRFGARSRALFEERFEAGAVADRMASFLQRVATAHPRVAAAPPDLEERLADVVREVLPVDAATAREAAAELLAPSPARWRVAAMSAEDARAAWQERAYEAERQLAWWCERAREAEGRREAAEASLERISESRSWRFTRPLRRAASALRRA